MSNLVEDLVIWGLVILAVVVLGLGLHDQVTARQRIEAACLADGRPAYECEAMARAAQ